MKRRRPYNPLAALTPQQQQALARQYVRSQTSPILGEINKEFAGKARAGDQAIAGYTNELAQSLAGAQQQTHNIYAGAQQQQGAIDSALANRIAAAGASGGAEVSAKLAQAGIAPSGPSLEQQGAGAAAASAGIGSAGLSALVAKGAAAENYAGQLPGIAKLGGLQRAKQYAAQLESERATQVGDLRSKIPGLTQSILGDIRNQEFQKAAANLSYGGDIYQANLNYKTKSQTNAERARHNRQQERLGRNTLAERARHNGRTEAEQQRVENEKARANRSRERQNAKNERGRNKRSKNKGKGKSKSNPWDG